ncbi:MAG: nicotinamide-nucleotide adenylyltransferase [Candidatus Korarchaeota archaeon]|nr:nicotinamide-nucleotide adenylyltransferase [Candidatus Korarchaeota archaeon]NIU83827.1 nicotinamide-nucleotide adenylyltransferase [Candidatus Thorarchaeota archaeon]NIW15241.1 nicotinamide-nucleotide adenylyltransferase [Candidatus Thorarchaeota archaeon]NIW53218.1 nicotinamide-nucleotide adenylyltransferase [Candidatus Korarchaeota archaeon]
MTRKSRGVLVGRFQPLHNGHVHVLERILEGEDEAIIAIGSAQESFTLDNPLTAGERIEMVRAFLEERSLLDRVLTVPIPDIEENLVWPARVKEYTPVFDRVYSGNSLVLNLFRSFEIPIVKLDLIRRDEYEGTSIRNRIANGKKWQQLVPVSILPVLKRVGFSKRIKMLSSWHKERGTDDEN